MMEQRKSGNGVKVAKRVERELAKKIKCYNNSKTQIRNQFCTEVNVKNASLRGIKKTERKGEKNEN
jgi:hypothetical protein